MKRSALIVGTAMLVVAAGATGVWLSQASERQWAKAVEGWFRPAASQPTPATASTATIALPESTPPPEPTNADFAPAATSTEAAAAPTAPVARDEDNASTDWAAMPIDELRHRANGGSLAAMEEMARRLVNGIGVAKDQQAGAGWLLRAAERGSGQSAFNVGVMYERGFVVERDSTKAIEWYRRAIDANVPMAKHNLALLLRDGKGAPRDGKEAIELLRSAARQGMAASMFTLGDIYERGDAGAKDPAIALAWFAIAAEFERQTNRAGESALGKMASQRVQVLKRTLLPGELERAQQFGQAEFKQIVEALQPPKPASSEPSQTAAAPPFPAASPPGGREPGPRDWPSAVEDQVRVVQQALVDLKFLRDKPDGALGPMTRNAIRAFQRSVGMRETGEPTRDVFEALQGAVAAAKAEPAKSETDKPAGATAINPATPEPSTEDKGDADAWPSSTVDQIKAIQALLRDLNFLREAPDGALGPATRTAIRDFERSLGMQQTGEPSKPLFESLKEMRALTSKAN